MDQANDGWTFDKNKKRTKGKIPTVQSDEGYFSTSNFGPLNGSPFGINANGLPFP